MTNLEERMLTTYPVLSSVKKALTFNGQSTMWHVVLGWISAEEKYGQRRVGTNKELEGKAEIQARKHTREPEASGHDI